jgi:hypothetical protein
MRLGQIVGDRIDVTVGNELFTTRVVDGQEAHWDIIYYLSDGGDLLCAYLADHVGVEQLLHRAGEIERKAEIVQKLMALNTKLLEEKADMLIRHGETLRTLYAGTDESINKLTAENAELTARLERVMGNFWKERAECAAWQESAKIWYTRYQTLRRDVLGRGFWAWALGRLTRNIDTGEFDPKGDKYPEDKDVLSCLPREKEEESEFVAP